MRKAMMVVSLTLLACFYLYINRQEVNIIDVHYDGYTAAVLVDRLPFSNSAKIYWWEQNQEEIRSKYHIPSGDAGPALITVYAFG